jgi:hypothetical protein
MDRDSRCRSLQPLRRFAQADGLDFAFDAPRATRLALFGFVTDHAFGDRQTGRRKAQRLALDQDSGEFDTVQLEPRSVLTRPRWRRW